MFTGPLSEVHFPIDNLTKKPKGFAFITYMIPENAVTALAQLDGHVFQVLVMFGIYLTAQKQNLQWPLDLDVGTNEAEASNIHSLVLLGQDASPASLHSEEGKDRLFRCWWSWLFVLQTTKRC